VRLESDASSVTAETVIDAGVVAASTGVIVLADD
jgi:hypothetical protein